MTRVAVTGIGSVSAAGLSHDELLEAVRAGKPRVQPVRDFNVAPFGVSSAALAPFDPVPILGKKGLRSLDQTTKAVLVAGKLAADDAGVAFDRDEKPMGVSLGCTFGATAVQSEFDRETLRDGPSFVNPGRFPYTVYNIQAGSLAIRQGAAGPNFTFADGPIAGMNAIIAATDLIQSGFVETVVAGGAESLSFDLFAMLHSLDVLGREDPDKERMPYSRRSTGAIAGSGACVMHLQHEDRAAADGRRVYGWVAPGAQAGAGSPEETADAVAHAVKSALAAADAEPADVEWICASGSGVGATDFAELDGLRAVFGERLAETPVTTPKLVLGETVSAGGAFQIALALLASRAGFVPPMPSSLRYLDDVHIPGPDTAAKGGRVLCVSTSWDGTAAAVVIQPEAA